MKRYNKMEGIEAESKGKRGGLGGLEARILSKLAGEGKIIFTIKDLKPLCKNPSKMVYDLKKKNWILKLKRGLYAIAELSYGENGAKVIAPHEFVIASAMAKPYCIAFWSALSYWGMSDQIPRSVFVAVMKFRKNMTVLNTRFEFITLPKYRFFGLKEERIGDRTVYISDKEKTIADCLDRPDLCGGIDEIARAFYFNHRELDFTKLRESLTKNKNNTALKRLLFILDSLGIEKEAFRDIPLSNAYSILDPTEPRKGKYDSRFRLFINKKLEKKRWEF